MFLVTYNDAMLTTDSKFSAIYHLLVSMWHPNTEREDWNIWTSRMKASHQRTIQIPGFGQLKKYNFLVQLYILYVSIKSFLFKQKSRTISYSKLANLNLLEIRLFHPWCSNLSLFSFSIITAVSNIIAESGKVSVSKYTCILVP